MRPPSSRCALAVLSLSLLGLPSRGAGTNASALCRDGRRVAGTLSLDGAGRLRFSPARRGAPLPLADLTRIDFAGDPPPYRAGPGLRLLLPGGDRLTGRVLGLDRDALTLQPAWAERVSVPRASVVSLTHLPGWRTLFEDDFSAGLEAWKVRGARREGRAVLLEAAGQALSYQPAAPLRAGRVGVNYRGPGPAGGARGALELRFGAGRAQHTVRVTVTGAGAYAVDAGGLDGTASTGLPERLRGPSSQWHRLSVRFGPRSLRLSCDGVPLWYSLERGPGGPLSAVSLKCESATPAAAVAWSAFSLEQAVDEPRRPPGDTRLAAAAGRDELWLADGDQLFGTLHSLDRKGATLRGRFGTRTFPWADLRGWFPRREVLRPRSLEGTLVRVRLNGGPAEDGDLLAGVVTALDGKTLTLRHALLGEVRIDRRHVRQLRFLPRSRAAGG